MLCNIDSETTNDTISDYSNYNGQCYIKELITHIYNIAILSHNLKNTSCRQHPYKQYSTQHLGDKQPVHVISSHCQRIKQSSKGSCHFPYLLLKKQALPSNSHSGYLCVKAAGITFIILGGFNHPFDFFKIKV